MRRLSLALAALVAVLAWLVPVVPARAEAAPGPPFPEPVAGQAVYDTAGLLDAPTIADAEATIDRIEERTGAEVVVYTQVKPGATTESTEEDAIALIDQWGVGRAGFDDGLAILMNVYTEAGGRVRGHVQLYAAPGFRALYLTNDERQQIFDDEMLPRLRDQQFGLPAALVRGVRRERGRGRLGRGRAGRHVQLAPSRTSAGCSRPWAPSGTPRRPRGAAAGSRAGCPAAAGGRRWRVLSRGRLARAHQTTGRRGPFASRQIRDRRLR